MEKDMVEPHGEESRIEWLISCVRWKETAAHPMSWLAVTFTTQEINSLIPEVDVNSEFESRVSVRPYKSTRAKTYGKTEIDWLSLLTHDSY